MSWVILLVGLLALLWLLAHYNFWRPVADPRLPRILMYHSVEPGKASGMNVSPQRFEQQLRYLKRRGYRSMTLSELAAAPDSERVVVITFDDGFRNNYRHAFPLLRQHSFKATIFLSPQIDGIEVLQPEEIREMVESGLVEFGAHTLHHVNLTQVDDDVARAEIAGSVYRVRALSGKPCQSFAYPFGRYAPCHVEMLRSMEIGLGVTVKKAIRPLANLLEIPRLGVNGRANLLQFHLIMSRGRYRV